jgi:hypothetical protein
MTQFMRDRESKQRRAVRARLAGEPLHAIDVDRRQAPLVRTRVYQGVSELKLPVRRRRRRQPNEPDGELRRVERPVAKGHGLVSAG